MRAPAAAGDPGFAVSMDPRGKVAHFLAEVMTPERQERFIPSFVRVIGDQMLRAAPPSTCQAAPVT